MQPGRREGHAGIILTWLLTLGDLLGAPPSTNLTQSMPTWYTNAHETITQRGEEQAVLTHDESPLAQVQAHCVEAILVLWSAGTRPDVALALASVQEMLAQECAENDDRWNQALTQLVQEGA